MVVGDPEISQSLLKLFDEVLHQPRDPAQVAQEVLEMRQRMYDNKKPPKGSFDIKQNRGCIIDIEFLAQYLILAHAHRHPNISRTSIPQALRALQRAGLLAEADFQRLEQAYGFLRLVENRLRLLHERSENRIGPDEAIRRRLGRLCHLDEGEEIIQVLSRQAKDVYGIYRRVLEASS